jgi:hypothetical protein
VEADRPQWPTRPPHRHPRPPRPLRGLAEADLEIIPSNLGAIFYALSIWQGNLARQLAARERASERTLGKVTVTVKAGAALVEDPQ